MKLDAATGARIANFYFKTPNAIDCNVFFNSASTKLILNMQLSTKTSELIHFDVSSVNLALVTMTAPSHGDHMQHSQGKTGMFMQGIDVWMFFPSVQSASTPYSSIFITKMNDVANMNWDATHGCT
jgi:hypothetical protein